MSEEQPLDPKPHGHTGAHLKPWHFKKGQSGNPAGRKTLGAYLKEYVNSFAARGLSELELQKIAASKKASFTERSAAMRCLILIERGDLADVQDFLDGKKSMKQLRDEGLDTTTVKKAKVVRKIIGQTDSGETITIESREIEFHARAGEEFDRLSDRTDGRPIQTTLVEQKLPEKVEFVTPMSRLRNSAEPSTEPDVEDSGD